MRSMFAAALLLTACGVTKTPSPVLTFPDAPVGSTTTETTGSVGTTSTTDPTTPTNTGTGGTTQPTTPTTLTTTPTNPTTTAPTTPTTTTTTTTAPTWTGTTSFIDADGDGSPVGDDCDDNNPLVNPGVDSDPCDGWDTDCDGFQAVDDFDYDGDGIPLCLEDCSVNPPGAGTVPTQFCETQPILNSAFDTTIEWSFTHQLVDPTSGVVHPAYTWPQYNNYGSVYQSPAVGQTTDDNLDGLINGDDIPDVVAVMASPTDYEGVIRVISGEGVLLDSLHWSSFTNANGTDDYAPYRLAGVALADVDGDGKTEVATVVVDDNDRCYPGLYEIGPFGDLTLEAVYGGNSIECGGHAAAIGDILGDGTIEIIVGDSVFDNDMNRLWAGGEGVGYHGEGVYGNQGYWNSGFHSFPHDVDGDGEQEIVAGRTIYNSDGTLFCDLGETINNVWYEAEDGYPALADVARFPGDSLGEPEVVLTGNGEVRLFRTNPGVNKRCELVGSLVNEVNEDPAMNARPPHPDCDGGAQTFGGPATIADFDGDGTREIAVAGGCYYSVYSFDGNDLVRVAIAETKDWSSASTGSTVFDFNGDNAYEVVFSDEEALYVWNFDNSPGLNPWERLVPLLTDYQHSSWTIHEYPLVADIDADGKAEILVSNSYNPDYPDHFGLYLLGSANDDWVTARSVWNQHAYDVTNVNDDGSIPTYHEPNYSPYHQPSINTFRTQAPGEIGALAAPNLFVEVSGCQDVCGELTLWIQVANDSQFVTVPQDVMLSVYSESAGNRTLITSLPLGQAITPGTLTAPYTFTITDLTPDSLVVVIDDPATAPTSNGLAKECDETDNEAVVDLSPFCK